MSEESGRALVDSLMQTVDARSDFSSRADICIHTPHHTHHTHSDFGCIRKPQKKKEKIGGKSKEKNDHFSKKRLLGGG